MSATLTAATAVVTGASSGIGRAFCLALARAGVRLILVGRDVARLDAVRDETSRIDTSSGATILACDLTDKVAVERLTASLGPVDVLVNAAGTMAAAGVHELDLTRFDAVLDTNLRGAFLMSRAVLPGMRERRRGIIVNVLSIAVRRSFPGMGAYAASKAGLAALSGVIREENRGYGIRVLDVVPGATRTPMWDDFWPDAPRERMMAAEEVADAAVAMLSFDGDAMVEELVVRPQEGDL